MAQRVTYRYYVGRKAMFDSDFKQGTVCQEDRFKSCCLVWNLADWKCVWNVPLSLRWSRAHRRSQIRD